LATKGQLDNRGNYVKIIYVLLFSGFISSYAVTSEGWASQAA